MDVELARTFLTIAETAHFGKAAQALNVTQSTINARIKTLEDLLGKPLFVRSKLGTTLTPAGVCFKSSTETMTRVWEKACQQTSLPTDYQSKIAIGAELLAWQELLLKWLPWVRSSLPDVAIRTEIPRSDGLSDRLTEQATDIRLTYVPATRPGLETEELLEEEQALITAGPETVVPSDKRYVYVNWGSAFRQHHDGAFPGQSTSALTLTTSRVGFSYVVLNGLAGYFPIRWAQPMIDREEVRVVESTPTIPQRVYLVYDNNRNDERFSTALQGLRFIAGREADT
ncbi:MAG: LysR family transcriptional regulator [Pseudomonadota bacterium]